MASNRYGSSYSLEHQVESQFMDRSTFDRSIAKSPVIIDFQTGLRFKRSSGSHFLQNSFVQTTATTITSRPVSVPPITPPSPAVRHSVLQLKPTIDSPDGFRSHIMDSQTPYSTQVTEASFQSQVEFKDTIPGEHVPISEYYKYIPSHFTEIQIVRQLMIWIALKELKNLDVLPIVDAKTQETRKILREAQLKYIQGLLKGEVNISWYAMREDSQVMFDQRENPVNAANEKKLEELDKAMKLFKDESEDWRNCTENIYDFHAAATNQMEEEEEQFMGMNDDQVDMDSIIDQLTDKQNDFLQRYDTSDTRQSYTDMTSSIDLGVTQLRQTLNTAHQFATKTGQYSDRLLAELAHRSKERARFVPIQQDRGIPGLFENSKEKRKQSENRSVEDILRLISRLPKKPKPSQ